MKALLTSFADSIKSWMFNRESRVVGDVNLARSGRIGGEMRQGTEKLEVIVHDVPLVIIEGYEMAILGVAMHNGMSEPVTAYDRDVCIHIIGQRHGYDEVEAEHYFETVFMARDFEDGNPIFISLSPAFEH